MEFSSTALLLITLVGATTTFFAASIGVLQNDLKRIIAFSTISQLGCFLILKWFFIIILIFIIYNILDFNFNILQVISAKSVPLIKNSNKNRF